VDGSRQQLFASSGFALNKDCRVGGRHGLNLPQYITQAGAFAHNVVEAVLEVDLIFKVVLFLVQPVAQLSNAPECHGVIHCHRHLPGNLHQHLQFALPKTPLLPTHH